MVETVEDTSSLSSNTVPSAVAGKLVSFLALFVPVVIIDVNCYVDCLSVSGSMPSLATEAPHSCGNTGLRLGHGDAYQYFLR